MWGETERSPALAAPGSNNFAGLIASSTISKIGSTDEKFQGPLDEEANDLCKRYLPLAYKIAADYAGQGIDLDTRRSAGLSGLVIASRKFDPALGTFGAYARHWVKGEITALFKKKKYDPLANASPIEDWNEQNKEECDDGVHTLRPDLSKLAPKERTVVEARTYGQSLQSVGNELGLSAERVRQIETRAVKKLRKGNIALACIRDLTRRRGYQKPARKLLPFRSVTYPCRSYTKAEVEAYERGEL
jgi:RNA polymerase sigma factor (sigma-70 family)